MQFESTPGTQGICPDGFHVPSDVELTTLTTYLGGDPVAGGKMKETGTVHWSPTNTGASNSSGFTAIPGGVRLLVGTFTHITVYNYLWSSSQNDETTAWVMAIVNSSEAVSKYSSNKNFGRSIRCLKN